MQSVEHLTVVVCDDETSSSSSSSSSWTASRHSVTAAYELTTTGELQATLRSRASDAIKLLVRWSRLFAGDQRVGAAVCDWRVIWSYVAVLSRRTISHRRSNTHYTSTSYHTINSLPSTNSTKTPVGLPAHCHLIL